MAVWMEGEKNILEGEWKNMVFRLVPLIHDGVHLA